jgi:hypothetical protein
MGPMNTDTGGTAPRRSVLSAGNEILRGGDRGRARDGASPLCWASWRRSARRSSPTRPACFASGSRQCRSHRQALAGHRTKHRRQANTHRARRDGGVFPGWEAAGHRHSGASGSSRLGVRMLGPADAERVQRTGFRLIFTITPPERAPQATRGVAGFFRRLFGRRPAVVRPQARTSPRVQFPPGVTATAAFRHPLP